MHREVDSKLRESIKEMMCGADRAHVTMFVGDEVWKTTTVMKAHVNKRTRDERGY